MKTLLYYHSSVLKLNKDMIIINKQPVKLVRIGLMSTLMIRYVVKIV